MGLEYHLYLAKKTIKYVRSLISGSSTEDLSWKKDWDFEEIDKTREGLDELAEKGIFLKYCHLSLFNDHFKKLIENKMGFCGELSILAFEYLAKRYPISIDICRFEGGDHILLVLGRPSGSNKDNIETWGDAVICDPWANKAYPVKQLEKMKKSEAVKLHPSLYAAYPSSRTEYHHLKGDLQIIHSEKPMKRSASNLKKAGDLFFSVEGKKSKDDNFVPIYSEKAFFTRKELAAKRKLTQDSIIRKHTP
ncbi:MAG: hypothetical protein LCH30_04190 [Proteobacteria bacterium]|nr:hypothetical protein [Pseudomonadota bacterium]